MSKFFTVRTPISVRVGDQTHTFFIRELGYMRLIEMNAAIGVGMERSARGLAIMKAICLAAIEEEDGTLSYTEEEWRDEVRDAVTQLSRAAMKAQHLDLDKGPVKEMTEEEAEGNAEPSRKSGANSPSTSAAPSVN
jgi:hypothetical protein